MGGGMVKNLIAGGFDVLAFDNDPEKMLALGNQATQDIDGIAKNCETVILCLPNPDVSKEVTFDKLLAENTKVKTIIETSTLSPEIVTEFAEKLASKGIAFLSAPMVGGKNHAADGTIEFLVEGEEKLLESAQDIFNAMGKARFMGAIPSATLAKITFNLCRYANLAIAVEAARLLNAYGANKQAIHEFMSEQSLDNFGQVWAEDMKAMMLSDVPFKPSQVPTKDLALFSEVAKSHALDSELIDSIRKTYLSME